jgi:hypothetical protein
MQADSTPDNCERGCYGGVQLKSFEGGSQKNILTSKPIVISLKRRYYRELGALGWGSSAPELEGSTNRRATSRSELVFSK